MKTKLTLLVPMTVFGLILSGCSTAKVRVLPAEKGLVKVFARDIEVEGAEEAALKAAKEYCEERNREAIFLKQQSQYTGKMDESTRKGIRAGANAVDYVPGASLLSSIGKSVTGDRDYQAAALFKCQKAIN